jgi:hypothetical protein
MTASLTKHPLSSAELTTLVRQAFGPEAAVAEWSELTDGSYNTAMAVNLADGRDLVLKVAPAPNLRLLTHEVDLMRTEVDVYRHSASAGVAAPSTVYADFTRAVIGTDYAFLSRVDGVSFDTVRDAMSPELAPFGQMTDRAWRRLDLYTSYLYVIMAIEGATRGWDSPERREYEAWLCDRLGEVLAKL